MSNQAISPLRRRMIEDMTKAARRFNVRFRARYQAAAIDCATPHGQPDGAPSRRALLRTAPGSFCCRPPLLPTRHITRRGDRSRRCACRARTRRRQHCAAGLCCCTQAPAIDVPTHAPARARHRQRQAPGCQCSTRPRRSTAPRRTAGPKDPPPCATAWNDTEFVSGRQRRRIALGKQDGRRPAGSQGARVRSLPVWGAVGLAAGGKPCAGLRGCSKPPPARRCPAKHGVICPPRAARENLPRMWLFVPPCRGGGRHRRGPGHQVGQLDRGRRLARVHEKSGHIRYGKRRRYLPPDRVAISHMRISNSSPT